MTRSQWVSIAAGCLLAAPATPLLAADSGFYFSAGVGRAEEDPGDSIGINLGVGLPPDGIVHVQPDRVEVESDGVAWSVAVGYRFTRYFAAELEYMDFGTSEYSEHYDLDIPPFPSELTRNYTSKVTGPAVSVLGSLPIGKGFEAFLRVGALFADREIEVPGLMGTGATTFGDTVWLGGAGVDWSFASRWGIRAEYQLSGDSDSNFLASETAVERVSLSLRFRH